MSTFLKNSPLLGVYLKILYTTYRFSSFGLFINWLIIPIGKLYLDECETSILAYLQVLGSIWCQLRVYLPWDLTYSWLSLEFCKLTPQHTSLPSCRSRVYFLWDIEIPFFVLATSIPRKCTLNFQVLSSQIQKLESWSFFQQTDLNKQDILFS